MSQIGIDDMEERELLGRGKFGVITKYKYPGCDYFYAVKFIKYELKLQVYVDREIQNLKSTSNHPNIVAYHFHDTRDLSATTKETRIVLDYCDGGDLNARVIENHLKVPELLAVKWLNAMANALSYLHSLNIIHRDFKAANILLTSKDLEQAELKLCDFGMSKYVDDANKCDRDMTVCVGTQKYFAPEQFTKGYDFKVDVWGLGILAHELFIGTHPFDCYDVVDLKAKLNALQNTPFRVREAKIHQVVRNFIEECFVYDPSRRPSINELLQHSLFTPERWPPHVEEDPSMPAQQAHDLQTLKASSLDIAQRNLQFITEMDQAFGPEISRKIATHYKTNLVALLNILAKLPDGGPQWKADFSGISAQLDSFLRR